MTTFSFLGVLYLLIELNMCDSHVMCHFIVHSVTDMERPA